MTHLHNEVKLEADCDTCQEDPSGTLYPTHECPNSLRRCGHHCNHSWDDGPCHWCGADFDICNCCAGVGYFVLWPGLIPEHREWLVDCWKCKGHGVTFEVPRGE